MLTQNRRQRFTLTRRWGGRILPSLILLLGFPLAVYAGWNSPAPLTIDSAGDVGQFVSMAIVNSHPAISYMDATNNDLKYVRASDVIGSAWTAPITIDSSGSVGSDDSLAVVNGNPAVSYFDNTNGDLKYVRANDADGVSWGTPIAVDTSGIWQVGKYTSLTVVNGNPAISYFDVSNNNLKYVRATDANGSSWSVPVIVDGVSGDVGQYTTLVVVSGNPAISYYDWVNQDLKYVRANDVNGAGWGAPLTIDSAGNVGQYASMIVVSGNPAIGYCDGGNGDLKYVRASDTIGSAWNTPIVIDNTGNVGSYISLAMVDGHPAISYDDFGNGDLKYVRASDAQGAAWNTPVTVDSLGTVGWFTSLVVVNGNPAIGYYDWLNRDLKYVRADNPTAITLEKLEARSELGPTAGGLILGFILVAGVVAVIASRRRKAGGPAHDSSPSTGTRGDSV